MMLCLSYLSTRLPSPLARTASDRRDAKQQSLCGCRRGDPASWPSLLQVLCCILVKVVIVLGRDGEARVNSGTRWSIELLSR